MPVLYSVNIDHYPRKGDVLKLKNGKHVIFIHDMLYRDEDDTFRFGREEDEGFMWCQNFKTQGMIPYYELDTIVKDLPQFRSEEEKLAYIQAIDKLDG